MFDRKVLSQNPSSSRLLLIFSAYGFFLLCKLYLYTSQPSASFYAFLAILCIVELVIWIRISRQYFPHNFIGSGLVLFYSIMSVYAITPLALLAYGVDIFPFANNAIKIAMLGQSIALTHIYLFFHLLIKPSKVECANLKLIMWLRLYKPTHIGGLLVSLMGLKLALVYYYNFIASGVVHLIGNDSRINIIRAAETGNTWLIQYAFFSWMMAITVVVFFKSDVKKQPFFVVASIMAVSLFMYVYISLGNRRELAIFLLFCLLLSVAFKKKLFTFIVVVSMPALLAVGLVRALSGSSITEIDATTNLLNLFGEFVFPHYPLLYYSSLSNIQYKLGESFFMLPGHAIPSLGLWEKSQSLAAQFAERFADSSMGFAFTPLAEGFVNFGWSAIVITPLLITLTFLLFIRLAHFAPLSLLILFSFSLDINRGEFTTIALQLIIFTILFYFFTLILQFKYPKAVK